MTSIFLVSDLTVSLTVGQTLFYLVCKCEEFDHILYSFHYNMWHLNTQSEACIFMLKDEWINAFNFSQLNLNFLESLSSECANHVPQNGADFYRK